MNLYTRCPGCNTVFRVTTRELQASNGRVRCGRCQQVFDAFASLTAQEPEAPGATPDATPAPLAATGPTATVAEIPQGKQASAASAPARPDPAASLYEWEFRMPPRRSRTLLWSLLSLLLLLAGTVQAAVAFHNEILVHYPDVRPIFEKACEWANCRIGLLRLAEQLDVESSELELLGGRANQIRLNVLLRNRAPVPVEFPAFELSLTDAQDQVLLRRVFQPAEYLSDPARSAGGLAGHGELSVRLYLDTGRINAAGYRVYFFYP
jgi:predicted Zn finger-like uncharacterized protein